MNPAIKQLFKLIRDFFAAYDSDEIEAQEFHDFYDLQFPNARNAESMHIMITEVFDNKPKPGMMGAIMDQFIEKHTATKMIEMLSDTMTGDKYGVIPSVMAEADHFIDIMENPPEELEKLEPVTKTILELVEEELLFEGLEWPLEELNDVLGGIRRKTLGLIYAYVDCGKTSLALNVAANCARQLHEKDEDGSILYLGNEEPASRMALRGVQAFTHCTRADLITNRIRYTEECREWGYDRLKFFGDVDTGDQVTSLVEEYKPRLTIIDIATDVDVSMEKHYGDEGVGYLKSLFKWYRRLSNRMDTAVLAVSQGTGAIENKRYPKLSDVYGSRSAVQGALDYAIGIGKKDDNQAKSDVRYINIPKNKLHDGLKAKIAVTFLAEECKWKS
jgi:KaiC/GvpD/RAD55 family RecA-like ATPase